jgi:hypothetical protein
MTRLRRAFGTVSADVLRDPNISTSAKALYSLLCTYADDDGVCWPSNETLAQALGSRASVKRWLVELADHGVLVREPRFVEGRQTTSITRLVESSSDVRHRGVTDDPPEGRTDDPPEGLAGEPQNKTSRNKTSRNTRSSSSSSLRSSSSSSLGAGAEQTFAQMMKDRFGWEPAPDP